MKLPENKNPGNHPGKKDLVQHRVLDLPGWLRDPVPTEMPEWGIHAPALSTNDFGMLSQLVGFEYLEIGLRLSNTPLCLLRTHTESRILLNAFLYQEFCELWNRRHPRQIRGIPPEEEVRKRQEKIQEEMQLQEPGKPDSAELSEALRTLHVKVRTLWLDPFPRTVSIREHPQDPEDPQSVRDTQLLELFRDGKTLVLRKQPFRGGTITESDFRAENLDEDR